MSTATSYERRVVTGCDSGGVAAAMVTTSGVWVGRDAKHAGRRRVLGSVVGANDGGPGPRTAPAVLRTSAGRASIPSRAPQQSEEAGAGTFPGRRGGGRRGSRSGAGAAGGHQSLGGVTLRRHRWGGQASSRRHARPAQQLRRLRQPRGESGLSCSLRNESSLLYPVAI